MAKSKIRPQPGALYEWLEATDMTQKQAADATRVDRKTLRKIGRGEEVKKDTLQIVATRLGMPISYFDPPNGDFIKEVTECAEEVDDFSV